MNPSFDWEQENPRDHRKLEIDGLLRRQADQQFKNDSGLLKRALAEVRSQDFTTLNDTNRCRRHDAWTDAKSRAARFSHHVGAGLMEVGPSAEEAMKLNIPRIASNPENTGVKSGLLMQTYKDFAIEIKRKNSNVSFSRDVLDTAFRISTTRLPKHAGGGYQQDKQTMIDRCLGKESEKYWKDAS
ncbi:hypothetical protein Q7P36_006973 [Cladosporium allicinum]